MPAIRRAWDAGRARRLLVSEFAYTAHGRKIGERHPEGGPKPARCHSELSTQREVEESALSSVRIFPSGRELPARSHRSNDVFDRPRDERRIVTRDLMPAG